MRESKLDKKLLEVIYTAFIRPILEYGDVVCDKCTQYEKEIIEKKKYKLRLLE